MQPDATNSAGNSDATSADAADPLARELAAAHAAILRELDEIKARFGKSADLHDLVGRHPWLSLAAASAVGFVAANVILPTRQSPDSQPPATPRQASATSPWWVVLVSPFLKLVEHGVERILFHFLFGANPNATATSAQGDGTPDNQSP